MRKIFFIILFSSIFSFSHEYWLKAEYEVQAFKSFLELENGDIITLGLSNLFVQGGGNIGLMSLYRVDKYGKTIWHKRYYVNGESLLTSWMEKASDGSILVVASTFETGFFSILKISTDGDIIWDKSYVIDFSSYDYKPDTEECYVKETADGGYLIFISFSPTNQPALNLLIKISSEGDILWAKDLRSKLWLYNFWKAGDENFLIFMKAWDPDLFEEVPVLMGIDSNANVIWAKTFFVNGKRAYLKLLKVEEDGSMVFEVRSRTVEDCTMRTYIKFSASFVPIIQRYYEVNTCRFYGIGSKMLKFDEEGNILMARSIKPFVALDVKESIGGYIIGVGGDWGERWPGYNYLNGLILKMDLYNGMRGACNSHTYYFNEISGNLSYEDFEIKLVDFDKSKIRMASNYVISEYSYYTDSEYICYTGCIRVAVCTEDFPPQCTIEKRCNE